MHVIRQKDAIPYQAPGHFGMRCLRLQGREAGPNTQFWVGMSIIEPGGGTVLSASGDEKVYVVLSGTVSISNGTDQVALAPFDSCRIAPHENRALSNDGPEPAAILLVMAEGAPPASPPLAPARP